MFRRLDFYHEHPVARHRDVVLLQYVSYFRRDWQRQVHVKSEPVESLVACGAHASLLQVAHQSLFERLRIVGLELYNAVDRTAESLGWATNHANGVHADR